MNIDNLHDALNLLDDEFIEEVDKLRTKRKRRKNLSMRWLSLAACFCIVILGVYVLASFGHWQNIATKDSACTESITEDSILDQNAMVKDEIEDSTGDTDAKQESISDSTDSSNNTSEDTTEMPSVLVEIVEWTDVGFNGKIVGIVDTTTYAEGTEVHVVFENTIYVGEPIENGIHYVKKIPNAADFSVGSVVRVQFYESESENEVVVLYVGEIAPTDTEGKGE